MPWISKLPVRSTTLSLIVSVVGVFPVFSNNHAIAAACCGGGVAVPGIIVGDEKAAFSVEVENSQVRTDVNSVGVWSARSDAELLSNIRVNAAHIFLDRFQMGFGTTIVRRARAGQESAGLGDSTAHLGYEILPEFEYSAWRPRGVSYLSLTLPTGRSAQESENDFLLDSRGRGFWAVGIGTTLTKNLAGKWDAVVSLEGHRSFSKRISNRSFDGELTPGWGALFGFSGGWNSGDTRLGAGITWTYVDAVNSNSAATSGPAFASFGAPMRIATGSLSLSQMFGEEWSASLSYTDQTLFGAPANSSLARGISLALRHQIAR